MSSSSSSNSKKIITFRCSDNEIFELDEVVALQFQTIKHIIEDGCADKIIPLTTIQSNIFAKVVEYCKQHTNNVDSDALKKWDEEFINVDQPTLFDLIHAANFLNIKGLLDLTCKTVADVIIKHTPEEIRKTFNIQNDFTPEEEEALRKQNQWAFDE